MSARIILPVLLVAGLTACDNLGLSREPENVTVEIQAVGVGKVTLITSTNWISRLDPACEAQDQTCPTTVLILDADTADVAVPYKRTFGFTDSYKYVIASYPAGGVTATVSMKVDVDGREWFNESRELSPTGDDGAQQTLQFVYQWQEPRIR